MAKRYTTIIYGGAGEEENPFRRGFAIIWIVTLHLLDSRLYGLHHRVAVMEGWRKALFQPAATFLDDLVTELSSLSQERHSLRQEGDLEILLDARIIGATTSGAAKYRELLTAKAAGVVLVEEAGEVLESHILSSLSGKTDGLEATKHLILIGDHKQLRP